MSARDMFTLRYEKYPHDHRNQFPWKTSAWTTLNYEDSNTTNPLLFTTIVGCRPEKLEQLNQKLVAVWCIRTSDQQR